MSELAGRRRIFLIVGAINVVALPACYLLLGRTTDVSMIALYSLVLAFLANAAIGPAMIFLNERFPTVVRASGTSLSWNLGFAVGRFGADFRVARQRVGAGPPGDAGCILRRGCRDLPRRRHGRAGDKGEVRLNASHSANMSRAAVDAAVMAVAVPFGFRCMLALPGEFGE